MSRRKITEPDDVTNLSKDELKRYRQRKRKQASRMKREVLRQQAALNKPVNLLANCRTFCSKNNYTILSYGGSSDFRIIALLEHNERKDFLVQERKIETGSPTVLQNSYSSKSDAQEDYDTLLTGNRPYNLHWRTVEHYHAQAKAFIVSHSPGGSKDKKPILELGFLYALDEVLEDGFVFEGRIFTPGKIYSAQKKRDRGIYRRNSLLVVQNQKIFPEDLFSQSEEFCHSVAKYVKTESNYFAILSYVNTALSTINRYQKAFGILWSTETFWKIALKIIKNYLKTGTNGEGSVARRKHYKCIPINDLENMFSMIKNEETLNMFVISLSTGMRPREVRRLSEKKNFYVLNKSHLNYKGLGLETKDYLITKTDAKVVVENLANPALSLVSKIILNHGFQFSWTPDCPFSCQSSYKKNTNSVFTNYVERNLRATCATMIAYCDAVDSIEKGRSTRDVAAQRLGHIDTRQVLKTYAPQVPSEFSGPAEYLKISSLDLDGTRVSDYSNLWDTYLLDKWLEWYQKNKKAYYSDIKQIVLSEAEKYISSMKKPSCGDHRKTR